ncbi:MAG TPA: T9SS type A sorting domain-containing protein [Bacteroidota bacterium]|nr:T9SS type A sorting domain-containing protein [Bacteroidota bacterium]
MKHFYTYCVQLVIILLMIGMSSQSSAQTVTVKMRINTSTCLDTLGASGYVQLSGASKLGTTPAITWDAASGVVATNVGGDYWDASFQAKAGDTIQYKFVTFFKAGSPTFHWSGWEGPIDAGIPSGDNRMLIVGTKDTTLPLQYINGWENKLGQFAQPFVSYADSITIRFRVNMGGADFKPATDVVDVRGGVPLGSSSWSPAFLVLSKEPVSVNGGSFWSGVIRVAKSAITVGTTKQEYKFVIQPDKWESIGNRSFTFNSTNDTTIQWKYYNNFPPSGPKVTANVLFALKLQALENAGLFNRALGDKVAVTGAKGWPPSTFTFATEPTMLKMTYDPDQKEWDLLESFTKYPKEVLTYKYYIAWDSTRVDSTKPTFIRGLQLSNGWEEPGVTGGADRSYIFTDKTQQAVAGDFGSTTQFFNSLHWKSAIQTPLSVKFTVDMAPATSSVTNPSTLFRPGIDTVYVQFDGCITTVSQGKTMWGTDNRIMLTDPDGDGKYTGTWNLKAPSLNQFCYRLVYTSPSGDITNGSGSAVKGRRYYQYIQPTKVLADSAQWPATFALAEVAWKLDNLTIEDPPNLDKVTAVENEHSSLPVSYNLMQNYPNPFNPSTIISYSVPEKVFVTLSVYNVLGQVVATLVRQEQTAGTHAINWNVSGLNLSSGLYLLHLQAGSFTDVKKMLFMK